MMTDEELADQQTEFVKDVADALAIFPFRAQAQHPRLPDFIAGYLMGRGYLKTEPSRAEKMASPI